MEQEKLTAAQIRQIKADWRIARMETKMDAVMDNMGLAQQREAIDDMAEKELQRRFQKKPKAE